MAKKVKNNIQPPDIVVKKVMAENWAVMAEHMDDWCKSSMDMYVADFGPSEEKDGWLKFVIVMATHKQSRERYDV